MPFGQLVIGSPGSGKTTYCDGLSQFMQALKRPISIVNLDPANGRLLPYPCAINISDLITVKDVMIELGLGPNGAMLYCMEYLEENYEWLENQLDLLGDDAYVAFDLPGQVELSTNHPSLRRILERLQKKDWRLVAVHLLDASHITDASRYISLLLLSLRAMLMLELPHVNVLSKVDLLGMAANNSGAGDENSNDSLIEEGSDVEAGNRHRAGGLGMSIMARRSASPEENSSSHLLSFSCKAFNLDYYTEVQDLSYLLDHLRSSQGPRRAGRFSELNEKICELVEDFGLVSFETLAIEDKRSMVRLQRVLDKATGYVYVDRQGQTDATSDVDFANAEEGARRGTAASAAALFGAADRGIPSGWGSAADVQERWVDNREDWEAFEVKERRELEDRWKQNQPGEESKKNDSFSLGGIQERSTLSG